MSDVLNDEQISPSRSGRRRRPRPSSRTLLAIIVTVVVAYLVIGPLTLLVVSTLQRTDNTLPLAPGNAWSLENLQRVFGSAETWGVVLTTLVYVFGALLIGGVVGIILAWLVERTDIPIPRTLFVLVLAGMGIPGIIFSISWALLLNKTNGLFTVLVRPLGLNLNIATLPGMIFVQGIELVPIVFLLVSAAFRAMDPALEDAAATSGASTLATLRLVTLPMLLPALLGTILYAFINATESLDVPLILGLPARVTVLSNELYDAVHPAEGLPNYGLTGAYGILMILICVIPLIIYTRIVRRSRSYVTISGKARRPRRISLGKGRFVALVAVLVYVMIALVFPMLMVLWASLQPFYSGVSVAAFGRISFIAYTNLFSSTSFLTLVFNTVRLGVLAAFITIVISLASSWLIVRSRRRIVAGLETLTFLPYLIPNIVIAISVLLLYLVFRVGVYNTVWIIVIAIVTKEMALGTRVTTPAVAQLSVSLEEAAEMSGGALRHVWFGIVTPLLRPAIAAGFLSVFLASIKNLTFPLLLGSPGNEVLSTQIYNQYTFNGAIASASAMSVLLCIVTISAAAGLRWLSGSRGPTA